jgi:hypothetical protein
MNWIFKSNSRMLSSGWANTQLTYHHVGIDHLAHLPHVILKVLPLNLPGKISDIDSPTNSAARITTNIHATAATAASATATATTTTTAATASLSILSNKDEAPFQIRIVQFSGSPLGLLQNLRIRTKNDFDA